jgi:uncharacterized membrane protein
MFFGLLILLVAVAVVYMFLARGKNRDFLFGKDLPDEDDSPLEIVNKQYARGEIDKRELERRRALLRGETDESVKGGKE